jgi:hypothetical protein
VVRMGNNSGQQALERASLRASLRGTTIKEGPHKDHGQRRDEWKFMPCPRQEPVLSGQK